MNHHRTRVLLAEALGPVNRWYCSQFHRCKVENPDLLLRYFIASGGAKDFAARYLEAMGDDNRWFCSQHYYRDIGEPDVLWTYYMKRCKTRPAREPQNRPEPDRPATDLGMAW